MAQPELQPDTAGAEIPLPGLDLLVKKYLSACTLRPEVLFRTFLPIGYRLTMLDTVPAHLLPAVLLAKVHLGMLITLYDDLADHPGHRNPRLLAALYTLNLGRDALAPEFLAAQEQRTFTLARNLFSGLDLLLQDFPQYGFLANVLRFDIEQFYACNRHSELMTELPEVRNLTESKTLGPHNMGIVAAGTIDLMASEFFRREELGQCREVFLLGQRHGRISNLIYTEEREAAEGDATNEIAISGRSHYSADLLTELSEISQRIRFVNLQSFSSQTYAAGFSRLHLLHASLEGRI